jgi:hypothetical protein
VSGRVLVKDLIVIVPGILGSRLRHRERGLVWGGARTLPTLLRPGGALALHGDGFGADPDVVADGLIELPLQLPGLSKITAYSALIRSLRQRLALEPQDLVTFAYDWRLACATNARLLAERVEPALAQRRRRSPDARLVFIAHSMGGLVVAHYTDVLGGAADTRRVITIGTPFRGAAKALGAIAAPPSGPLASVRARIQALVRTLPSVYELLPRYRVVVAGDTRRLLTVGDLPEDERVQGLFAAAAGFHEAIERSSRPPYKRHVVVGSHQPTAQFATVDSGRAALHDRWGTLDERGDGTVPRQSVAPPGWEDDSDAVPFCQAHAALPGTDDVTRLLHHVLTARPRAEQGPQRAKLALDAPDLAAVGERLTVRVEVAEGDAGIPLLVSLEQVDGRDPPRPRAPRLEDGVDTVHFDGLAPGDYIVRVQAATRLPDVRPVWDLLTVIEPGA